jgi:hypothetical protein
LCRRRQHCRCRRKFNYHEDKYYTKPLKNFVYERYKMGLFGDKTENIVISQAAAGGNTNSVNVKMPIWEIILISSAIAAIVFLCCSCLIKKLNYFCENEIKKQARIVQLENGV